MTLTSKNLCFVLHRLIRTVFSSSVVLCSWCSMSRHCTVDLYSFFTEQLPSVIEMKRQDEWEWIHADNVDHITKKNELKEAKDRNREKKGTAEFRYWLCDYNWLLSWRPFKIRQASTPFWETLIQRNTLHTFSSLHGATSAACWKQNDEHR